VNVLEGFPAGCSGISFLADGSGDALPVNREVPPPPGDLPDIHTHTLNVYQLWDSLLSYDLFISLYISHTYKWYCPTTCNLREDPIPFIYSLEIGLYLSKLYKVR